MVTWNNLDTLASFKELSKSGTCESCRGNVRRERCRPCEELQCADGRADFLTTMQQSRWMTRCSTALEKLAEEAQLAEKFEALYNGEVINTGEKRLVLHHMTTRTAR